MLHIHLRSTGERFALKAVHFDTAIRELKTILEIICGVPAHLQILSYLDEGNLLDSQTLRYYDPVPNCTLVLDVWFIYEPIVKAVVDNNTRKLFELGVLPDVPFSSAIADRLSPAEKQAYIQERASIAMFTAAHREKLSIVRHLCEHNVGINYQTAAGRTPLMVATARGSLRVMELLLEHGARLNTRDAFGQTAEKLAVIFNQTQSRRTIIKFRWKKRNEASIVRERETKSAQRKQPSETEQIANERNRKREERVARLADQRRKREEQLATQRVHLPRTTMSQTRAEKRPSRVKANEDDHDPESDTLEPSVEHLSIDDTSVQPTTHPQFTQKLFAHQFYNVYAGMNDDEWVKVRNAFVAQLFGE